MLSQTPSKKGRPSAQSANDSARALLIAAARQKFVSKPYDKVSIRELATLAGVNSAMIKYYFQSKEGLYKAMILEVTGQVMSNIQQQLQSGQMDNLEDFFRIFVEVVKQSPEFPLLMLKEVVLNQGVCQDYFIEQMGSHHMKVFDQIYWHFEQAGKLKANVDPLLFRMSLMGLMLHPWHMREVVCKVEGISYDDDFLEAMIKHNSQLMQFGLFASDSEKSKGENDEC